MKRLNIKNFLSLFLALILSCGVLCFAGCKTENIPTNSIDLNVNNFDLFATKENGISLTRKKAILIKDNNGDYLQETLTANIIASDLVDKTLVWSVQWVDDSVTANLSEYLIVEPLQVGGNVANVKCYKNFEEFGTIVITVSSKKDDNIFASCVVNYIGKPTDIELLDENNVSIDLIEQLEPNSSYVFKINQKHPIDVGSFYKNYDVTFRLDNVLNFEIIGKQFNKEGALVKEASIHYDLNIDEYNALQDFDDYYKKNKDMFDRDYAGVEFRSVEKIYLQKGLTNAPSAFPACLTCSSFCDVNGYIDYSIDDNGLLCIYTGDYNNYLRSNTIIYPEDDERYDLHTQFKLQSFCIIMEVKNKNSGLTKTFPLFYSKN